MTDIKLSSASRARMAEYVDKLCRQMNEPQDQVEDFREEMTANLTSAVVEEMRQGMPEDEAVTVALLQFGELKEVKRELVRIYKIRRTFASGILRSALLLLLLSAVSLGLIIGMWNERATDKYVKDVYQMVQAEAGVPGTITLSEPMRKKLKDWVDHTWGVKGVLIEPSFRNSEQKVDMFTYAKNQSAEGWLNYASGVGEVLPEREGFWVRTTISTKGYPSGGDNPSEYPFVVHVAMSYFNYTFFYSLGLFLLGGYFLLFAVWAGMRAYDEGRGNVAWVLLFLVTNVLGYGLYVLFRRWERPVLLIS
ncbi:hypothetical protein J7E73_09610 [Paenibacillus albidus]|uniref:permease prefix domain 1-containing protein n=1 Tax=Paenibacillus albidus TaxID=2041023 RepID=UPI001BEB11FE|nr:permease prefix domain 1-containing protein [Paenibacillus albidus]MBT2289383.1 hypothetical protein [Paenibacillus albidus]